MRAQDRPVVQKSQIQRGKEVQRVDDENDESLYDWGNCAAFIIFITPTSCLYLSLAHSNNAVYGLAWKMSRA